MTKDFDKSIREKEMSPIHLPTNALVKITVRLSLTLLLVFLIGCNLNICKTYKSQSLSFEESVKRLYPEVDKIVWGENHTFINEDRGIFVYSHASHEGTQATMVKGKDISVGFYECNGRTFKKERAVFRPKGAGECADVFFRSSNIYGIFCFSDFDSTVSQYSSMFYLKERDEYYVLHYDAESYEGYSSDLEGEKIATISRPRMQILSSPIVLGSTGVRKDDYYFYGEDIVDGFSRVFSYKGEAYLWVKGSVWKIEEKNRLVYQGCFQIYDEDCGMPIRGSDRTALPLGMLSAKRNDLIQLEDDVFAVLYFDNQPSPSLEITKCTKDDKKIGEPWVYDFPESDDLRDILMYELENEKSLVFVLGQDESTSVRLLNLISKEWIRHDFPFELDFASMPQNGKVIVRTPYSYSNKYRSFTNLNVLDLKTGKFQNKLSRLDESEDIGFKKGGFFPKLEYDYQKNLLAVVDPKRAAIYSLPDLELVFEHYAMDEEIFVDFSKSTRFGVWYLVSENNEEYAYKAVFPTDKLTSLPENDENVYVIDKEISSYSDQIISPHFKSSERVINLGLASHQYTSPFGPISVTHDYLNSKPYPCNGGTYHLNATTDTKTTLHIRDEDGNELHEVVFEKEQSVSRAIVPVSTSRYGEILSSKKTKIRVISARDQKVLSEVTLPEDIFIMEFTPRYVTYGKQEGRILRIIKVDIDLPFSILYLMSDHMTFRSTIGSNMYLFDLPHLGITCSGRGVSCAKDNFSSQLRFILHELMTENAD